MAHGEVSGTPCLSSGIAATPSSLQGKGPWSAWCVREARTALGRAQIARRGSPSALGTTARTGITQGRTITIIARVCPTQASCPSTTALARVGVAGFHSASATIPAPCAPVSRPRVRRPACAISASMPRGSSQAACLRRAPSGSMADGGI